MKKAIYTALITGIALLGILASTPVDINNDNDVIKSMQGTWVGSDHTMATYGKWTHYKLTIEGEAFSAWIELANTNKEPNWDLNPTIIGTYTLGEVKGYTNATSSYRNIYFEKNNPENDEGTLTINSLRNMIIYDQGGLYVSEWGRMNKK